MRRIARAIIIRGEQLLVMKRNKHGDMFFTLPGGGIDDGETAQQAAEREVREEASIECRAVRELYHERVKEFGETYYYLCDYVSGEPALAPNSEEAIETAKGENTFQPMWLEIRSLEDSVFYPRNVAHRLEKDLDEGFSEQVIKMTGEKESL